MVLSSSMISKLIESNISLYIDIGAVALTAIDIPSLGRHATEIVPLIVCNIKCAWKVLSTTLSIHNSKTFASSDSITLMSNS